MQTHVEALAVDLLLAGPMKVKLLKHILLSPHCNGAAGGVIDHDGVAVINDLERRGLVIELNQRQVCSLRIANVDGRLMMTSLAPSKLRFQVTPMVRSERVTVIPNVLPMSLLRSSTHQQGKRTKDDASKARFAHIQVPRTSCSRGWVSRRVQFSKMCSLLAAA